MKLRKLFTCALLLITSIILGQYNYEPSDTFPFGKANPEAPKQLKDFQPLIGECNCKSISRKQDRSWADPVDMIWKWEYIMNGMAVQDKTLKADGKHSGSIRQFIADSSRWYVHYYSSGAPSTTLSTWEGNKNKDGNIVLYRDNTASNGTLGWFRLTFYDITKKGYKWVGEWVDKAEKITYPTWKIECIRNEN